MNSFISTKKEIQPKKEDENENLTFAEWRKRREQRSQTNITNIFNNKAVLLVLGVFFFILVVWLIYRGKKTESKSVETKTKLKTLPNLQNKKYSYQYSDDSDIDIEDALEDLDEDELEALINNMDD